MEVVGDAAAAASAMPSAKSVMRARKKRRRLGHDSMRAEPRMDSPHVGAKSARFANGRSAEERRLRLRRKRLLLLQLHEPLLFELLEQLLGL